MVTRATKFPDVLVFFWIMKIISLIVLWMKSHQSLAEVDKLANTLDSYDFESSKIFAFLKIFT
jgi:uncharacterized membrane-anchored protein